MNTIIKQYTSITFNLHEVIVSETLLRTKKDVKALIQMLTYAELYLPERDRTSSTRKEPT